MELKIIGHIESDFPTKFGVPRQSGLADSLRARIVFADGYDNEECMRGLEGFTHLWVIWGFSGTESQGWRPTVRPPRLGGNKRVGVFATRSPFRPNPLGLSCVRIIGVSRGEIEIGGADMMNGTPVYDVKPYVPYADCHSEATGGFTDEVKREPLTVAFEDGVEACVPVEKRDALREILALDPRPSYHNDGTRTYSITFAGLDVMFVVDGCEARVLKVMRLP